jgi:hypothetical protein
LQHIYQFTVRNSNPIDTHRLMIDQRSTDSIDASNNTRCEDMEGIV